MANYKTRGIIIRRSNFGEADRLLTIFTERFGKIKVIAKGARKTTSRLGGNLEPFCLANLVIAEGRNLDIVCEAEIIECFFAIRNNLKSTHISYYLAEAIDKLTGEHEKHPEVLDLLLEVLNKVGQINDDLLISYFELNLLSILGFGPEIDRCLACHKILLSEDNFFDSAEGGIVCSHCQPNGIKISNNAIKLLRFFLKNRLKNLKKLITSIEIQKEAKKITQNYIDYISQQEFKSRRFLPV